VLITDSRTLADFCARLAGSPYIAVDTEFLREKTYWPKLCLVQVAYGGEAAAIDPLAAGIDLSPLFALFDNQGLVKVLHSASQDMEVFLYTAGRLPRPVFDTQVAAMVAGYGEQVGYAALANKVTGARIDKASQSTDWSRRPLTERQIAYALDDVIHLCAIYEHLLEHLAESERGSWVAQEMAALDDPARYRTLPTDAWQRLKIRRPTRRTLAVLRAIAGWREETAQQRDLPRGWVVRDEALIEIAEHLPRTVAELERVRGLKPGTVRGRDGDALLAAVTQALASPEEEWPQLPARDAPVRGGETVVSLLQALLKLRCEEHDVAPKLVANRDELQRIATSDSEELRPLRGWRRALFGADALALKAGQLALTVGGGGVRAVRLEPGAAKPEPGD
jgi:ribonuclease D